MEPDDKAYTITLSNGDVINLNDVVDNTGSITIDLSSTYGATTTYLNDSMDTITISDGTNTSYTLASDWSSTGIEAIEITSIFGKTYNEQEIDRMCKEYPALEKVWRNFKTLYDLVKQDYEGKKKAGELDNGTTI